VHERPADIPDSAVVAALTRQWALTMRELSYLPVGFGGYHWRAVDQTGSRWFVTVSDLSAPWVSDLTAAMQTAAWLAGDGGLEFVVAPVPTTAGQIVGSLDSRHALTLFPYVDAAPSRFGDEIDDGDRPAIIDLLARLHTATPQRIQLTRRPLELPARPGIEQALASLDAPWRGGPYAEPGRDLLLQYERPLRRALARFDDLLDRVGKAGGPYVITHGEPHPGNLLRTPAGLRLVDWDMTALARPERDLWWVIAGDQDAARYSRRTGSPVNQDALALYRLRWGLDDIAEFVSEIRGPHQQTADTLVSWTSLQDTLEAIAQGLPGSLSHQRRPGDNAGMAPDDSEDPSWLRLALTPILDGAKPSEALGWVFPLAPVVTQAAAGAGHWAAGRRQRALAEWAGAAGFGLVAWGLATEAPTRAEADENIQQLQNDLLRRFGKQAPATAGTETPMAGRLERYSRIFRLDVVLCVVGMVIDVPWRLRHPRRLTALAVAAEAEPVAFNVLRLARAGQQRRPRMAAGSALIAVGSVARLRAASAEPLRD